MLPRCLLLLRQVAELIGSCLQNPDLATNKVLEVVAETTAPPLTPQELLATIGSDVSRVSRGCSRL